MKRYVPVLSWLPTYQRKWLRLDVIAGLTIMALLVPEGMAYAELAGVPPQTAFYAAPIGLILYAVFGTSRQLVVAVSSGIAVMSASVIGELAPANSEEFIALTVSLALLAGGIAVIAGLLRLGRLARFFSPSVLTGFVSGLALFIIIKQLPKVLGLETGEGNSWQRLFELVRNLPEAHLNTLIVGLSTAALMLLIERRFHRIPAALVALVYGIVVSGLFGLEDRGVHVVGDIPSGLALPQLPDLSPEVIGSLLPGALAIVLVMFGEALGPARTFAGSHGYRIRDDQELIGLGMANVGAGLFQGFAIGASLSKSAAADAAGQKTQVSAVVAALATALVALFFTPLFRELPEATLGAIVIVAVLGMVHVDRLRRLFRIRKTDFVLAAVALVGVLSFEEVVNGLLVAVLVSLVALVARTSKPKVSTLVRLPGTAEFRSEQNHPEGLSVAGLLIVRPDEGVFFANSGPILDTVRDLVENAEPAVRVVLLDLELSSDLDVPGAVMLIELHRELKNLGVEVHMAGLHAPVREMMERGGAVDVIGAAKLHTDVPTAFIDLAGDRDIELAAADLDVVVKRLERLTELASQHRGDLTAEQRQALERAQQNLAPSEAEDSSS